VLLEPSLRLNSIFGLLVVFVEAVLVSVRVVVVVVVVEMTGVTIYVTTGG